MTSYCPKAPHAMFFGLFASGSGFHVGFTFVSSAMSLALGFTQPTPSGPALTMVCPSSV